MGKIYEMKVSNSCFQKSEDPVVNYADAPFLKEIIKFTICGIIPN